MTEKRTLALSTRQWRVLLHDNLDVLKAAVQQTEAIDETGLKQFCAQLDDMEMLAGAWFQVSVPPEVSCGCTGSDQWCDGSRQTSARRPPKAAEQVMQ